MISLTHEQELFLKRAQAVEAAQATEFWPVLKDFCQDVSRQALLNAQVNPANSQWHAGAAKVALDIFDRLNEIPAQKAAMLAEMADSNGAASEPKTRLTGRQREPLSHL